MMKIKTNRANRVVATSMPRIKRRKAAGASNAADKPGVVVRPQEPFKYYDRDARRRYKKARRRREEARRGEEVAG